MGILKLQNEGDSHTMLVRDCKEVPGNYGQQVMFTDGTDTLYLPKDSADRQLARIGFADGEGSIAYGDVIDMTLTFSRDPNPKKGAKPYWGIRYVGTDAPEPKASPRAEAPKAPSASVASQPRRDAIVSQYLILWDTMAHHLAQTSQKYGYGLDAAAIQAATATVWISWKDKGIQPDGLPEAKPVEKAPEVKMPAPTGKRLAPPSANEPPDFSNFPPPTDDDLPF
jgi:hypothetical protein